MSPKVSSRSRETSGFTYTKPVSAAPFPYVILGGRDDVAASAESAPVENGRTWFAAYAESAAPRWNNAREALARSLAISSADTAALPHREDAAWDGGAVLAPARQIAPVAEVPIIKLRAKRRELKLNMAPVKVASVAAIPAAVANDSREFSFPVMQDGLAPLMPIPGADKMVAQVALPPATRFVPLAAPAPVRESDGRFEKVAGAIFFCGLAGVIGFWAFKEYVSPGMGKADSTPVVAAEVSAPNTASKARPEAVVAAPAVSAPASASISAPEVATAGKLAEPAQASPAFTNYVRGLRVSGVSFGASPRAFINGRTVNVGDLIEPMLGVRLASVDGASRHLVFEDTSGARVTTRY